MDKIVKEVGSDLRLFFHAQGYQKNLKSVFDFFIYMRFSVNY